MFNYSGLVFDVTGVVCCNFRCQTYLESNSNFSAHFAELKLLSELLLVCRRLHIPDSAPCKTLPADWIWFKGGSQNFFQPELLILSQGGWGSDQIPKQALPWNCQNTWDKILDQSAKKIWARSSFKQQTLANDILLDSGSRDPTCCIINVHFSVLRSCLLYLLYLWSNECSSHPFLFPSFITWCTIAHGMAWPISLICLYSFSKQHISYIHYTPLLVQSQNKNFLTI